MLKCNKLFLCMGLSGILALSGCGKTEKAMEVPDPAHPVTVVLWNYYNGQTKSAFDALVTEFNETEGMEKGIVVDSVSQGSLQELADSVYESAEKQLGSEEMPNIFAGYPDNVFRVDQTGMVADLGEYFTEEDLSLYNQDFLSDCYMGADRRLKVIPAARSTEVMYLNKTDWDRFAEATGTELESLSTWEGVADAAKQYYEWTDSLTEEHEDGKAFLGVDSFATFMIIASEQLGQSMYQVKDGQVVLQFDREVALEIWNMLYVPYLRGYFANYGSYRSDDEKTGDILAYIGSSAGAQYFPTEVTLDQDHIYQVESMVLPYPCFEDGKKCAIAQGAGFAVAESDPVRKYASVEFIKWITNKEQNVEFAIASGYLPVTSEGLAQDLAVESRKNSEQYREAPTVARSIETAVIMLDQYELYANPSFYGSYELRGYMNHSLLERLAVDQKQMEEEIRAGATKQRAAARFAGTDGFEAWYEDFMLQTEEILKYNGRKRAS